MGKIRKIEKSLKGAVLKKQSESVNFIEKSDLYQRRVSDVSNPGVLDRLHCHQRRPSSQKGCWPQPQPKIPVKKVKF